MADILNPTEPINDNPITVTYEIKSGGLVKKETPTKIAAKETYYNIEEAKKEIDKINNVITLWESKKAPYQAVVNKFNEINI